MDRVEAKDYLLKKFITEYGSTTPVAFTNNEDFTKPVDSPWVRFAILNNKSIQATMGGTPTRRFERYGLISFQVFIPINTGTYEGDTLCEQILSIFEGKRFGEIVCKTGSYKEIGITGTDTFLFDGTLPFTFDESK